MKKLAFTILVITALTGSLIVLNSNIGPLNMVIVEVLGVKVSLDVAN